MVFSCVKKEVVLLWSRRQDVDKRRERQSRGEQKNNKPLMEWDKSGGEDKR